MFDRLQKAIESRNLELRMTATGINPEITLVIETIGTVDGFFRAVRRIPGLEWMCEIDIDEIVPDEDFYYPEAPDRSLSGRLFLVMTDQAALQQIRSLWQRVVANGKTKLPTGLAKFKHLLQSIKTLRPWGVKDRLHETGMYEYWKQELIDAGAESVTAEIELWFRDRAASRKAREQYVTKLVEESGGTIVGQSVVPQIAHHALLVQLTRSTIEKIVADPNTKLVCCDDIMFFRPTGQMGVGGDDRRDGEPVPNDSDVSGFGNSPKPEKDPVVALLDGMPLENHQLLAGRLRVDDPDDWASAYQASERNHGTAMASLIVHGDISVPNPEPTPRFLYVRPIMKPMDWVYRPSLKEAIPKDVPLVDLIHQAVRRLFVGEQGAPPAAPKIKIINLSIGDQSRQFAHALSPLARLLDWLSFEYNVLFMISAGNHNQSIELSITQQEFETLSALEKESTIVKAVYEDMRNRRLLSPGESINGLSIGAVHRDHTSAGAKGRLFDPYVSLLPGSYSALGFGYRRSVKPDFVYTGGRHYFELAPSATAGGVELDHRTSPDPPGNRVAAPKIQPGQRIGVVYSCGTSDATALASRVGALCYDTISQVLANLSIDDNEQSVYIVPLIKALLVHGCSWGEMGRRLKEILKPTIGKLQQQSDLVTRLIGHGMLDADRVQGCTAQRATVLGFGQLVDKQAHEYQFPLPPSLHASTERRRVTVTLAWISPIAPKTYKYRAADMWASVGEQELVSTTRADVSMRASRRGTVQHEIFSGNSPVLCNDGDYMAVKVNCREGAGKIETPVPYGVAVSLEVKEGVDIPIYEEIRARIKPPISVKPG